MLYEFKLLYVTLNISWSHICFLCCRRGLNPPHRVKSVSITTFTDEEIEKLKKGGNEVIKYPPPLFFYLSLFSLSPFNPIPTYHCVPVVVCETCLWYCRWLDKCGLVNGILNGTSFQTRAMLKPLGIS